ncbi:MAG TPA: ClpXP protease specificity-enhancing factor [Chloroflexi bacterium]|nr:ClpXP protease specificity-enhancing factor [Chloroflexota bacterium]
MTSSRPYLIRALYEWIVDNGFTPYLLVDAEHEAAQVPAEYVHDGRIVLNIAPRAVQALDLGNEAVRFRARFAGQPREVSVPVEAVAAIYAMENNKGMVFGPEEEDGPPPGPPPERPGKPSLKVVK